MYGGGRRRRIFRTAFAVPVALAVAAGVAALVAAERSTATPPASAPAAAISPVATAPAPLSRPSAPPASGRAPAAVAAVGAGAGRPAEEAAAPRGGLHGLPVLFRRAWVRVPVATVWNHPATDRPEDAPAVSSTPDVAGWLASLDLTQKLGLDDLLATQALLDQPVIVFGHRAGWDHVIVLDQKGAVYPFGIAGWMPDRQLSYTAPPAGQAQATVAVPMVRAGGVNLSYGTRAPVVAADAHEVTLALPYGRYAVPAGAVRTRFLAASGGAVVAEAQRFLGLPYLWAGTSAYGYDCSGLTFSVYRQFGITLARDAADQARSGTPVDRNGLRPGDLVFFAFGGPIDHVGIYAGNGMMIDSPRTGASVELVPLWRGGLAPYYAGARRYI